MIILAGAFLLRAVTEGGGLPLLVGVGIGLIYATLWLVMSARSALSARPASASFHGACAALIALPLLWEATARFHVLPASTSATAVSLLTGAALWIAVRVRLQLVGWIFACGAMLTWSALSFASPPGVTATIMLVALAAALAVVEHFDRWSPLHWFTAVAADLGVLRLATLTAASVDPSRSRVLVRPGLIITVAVLTAGAFLAILFERAGRRRLPIRLFDLFQTGAAIAVGLGGALWVATATGISVRWLGGVTLAVAASSIALAFTSIDRATGRGPHFILFSTLGLACVLVGVPILAGRDGAAAVWGLLAVASALFGARYDRVTLRAHALVYVTGATVAGSAFHRALDGLVSPNPSLGWSRTSPLGYATLACAAATLLLIVSHRERILRTWAARIPLTILIGFCALLAVGHAAPPTAAGIGLLGGDVAGALASARTVLLSLAAVALAGIRRFGVLPEAAWVAYPTLGLALIELVVGDLAAGSARTLFLSFLVYGVALAVTPWLLRVPSAAVQPPGDDGGRSAPPAPGSRAEIAAEG